MHTLRQVVESRARIEHHLVVQDAGGALVGWCIDAVDRERMAVVDVGIIAQYVYGQGLIFGTGGGVNHGHRTIVGAGDGDLHCTGGTVDAGDLIGLGDGVVDIQLIERAVGGEGPGASSVDGEVAYGAQGGAGVKGIVGIVDVVAGQGAIGAQRRIGLG
ncbi:hypothetical protein D3C78_1078160 [compost metagenome]